MLARDIVRINAQTARLTDFIGQLSALSLKISCMSSLNELNDAMTNAAQAMCLVSSKLDTNKLRNMAKVMAKEDAKLEMKQDMMSDVLDGVGESLDDPVEQEEIYRNVLADVGLEVDKILPDSEKAGVEAAKVAEEEKKQMVAAGDDDLDAMLNSLQGK